MKHMGRKRKESNVWGSILYFTEEVKIYLLSKIIFYHKTQNTLKPKKATFEATSFDETYDMKKATSSEETYDVKKATSFEETYEVKKGKKK